MKNKNMLSVGILALIFTLILIPTSPAKAVTSTIKTTTTEENIQAVPIKALTEKMGGKVIENKEKGYTDFVLSNGKTLRVDPKIPVALVDGKTVPYRTVNVDGIIFPDFFTPVLKNGDYLIPTYVLQKYCGLEIKDDLLIFEVKDKEDSNKGNDSSKGKVIVEKPADSKNSNKGNDSNKGKDTTTKPSDNKSDRNPNSSGKYTGTTVASKLPALGWTPKYGGYEWNKYGANGSGYGRYGTFSFSNSSQDWDVTVVIYGYSKEFATALNKTFNLILPTKGNYLLNYVSTTDIKGGEKLNLDGRKIWFEVYEDNTMRICFGPIN